ncbi:unnamed protein product [Ceratitis capitata]|uniref:(Mediterranean fruit fly) hypothetical protein n=1 Tax=Ceratitis capitata TaxID=7213 RepID=A0A811UYS3_CERCA|nr:unnamed protein product [Ceratitis capitata]
MSSLLPLSSLPLQSVFTFILVGWKRIDDINNASALFHLKFPSTSYDDIDMPVGGYDEQFCKDILWQEDVKSTLYFIERHQEGSEAVETGENHL